MRAQVAFGAGEELIAQGKSPGALYMLREGWALRTHTLANGSRQILDVLLPGDLVGLPHLLLGGSNHAVTALTAVSVCVLDSKRFWGLMERRPALGLSLLVALVEEQERADVRLSLLGRMGAGERIGYLLLELRERLGRIGLARGRECPFPLQRGELADAVGLSRVHVIRAVRRLREQGLARLDSGSMTIPSPSKLARYAGYRSSYSGPKRPIP